MEKNNESLRHKAYQLGLKFKNSKLEEEVIYAKLEKQGIPVQLAKEVAENIVLERNKYKNENFSDFKKFGILMILIWALLSIIAYIFTKRIFVAFELLVIIVPTAILVHLMTTNK